MKKSAAEGKNVKYLCFSGENSPTLLPRPTSEERVQSCDGSALADVNPSVRADPPQHRGQQQTESGDTEDQQVHLSQGRRATRSQSPPTRGHVCRSRYTCILTTTCITDLSGNDASPTRTAAQHEGEFADLGQAGGHDPSDVPRGRRQDHRQHQHGHNELREEVGWGWGVKRAERGTGTRRSVPS